MGPDAPGQVITFYSYKGGTGRTMALANIGCLLAQRASSDKGVLMIDWDLEAPGLHKYFRNHFSNLFSGQPDLDLALREKPGLIELFEEFDKASKTSQFSDAKNDEDTVRALIEQVQPERFALKTDIHQLWLMKAGAVDDQYSSKVSTFDWEDFYTRVPTLFRLLAERLSQHYQYVLIDSRTGLNDASGICAMLMPEKLVVVFTPNRQSLEGALDLVRRATNYRSQSDDLRPLLIFPLPSRIEASEPTLRQDWRFGNSEQMIIGYEPLFQDLFRKIYKLSKYQLTPYFNEIGIQHSSRYSYGEEIAALTEVSPMQSQPDRLSLTRSYEIFLQWLIRPTGPWNDKDAPAATSSEPAAKSPALPPNLVVHRDFGKKSVILFIQGNGLDYQQTWGRFPDILASEKSLDEWDILSLGFHTQLNIALSNLWSPRLDLELLAGLVRTNASLPPFSKYENIALLAHSTGGLLVQRLLVDDDELVKRVRHVFLFGTPSLGLKKASLLFSFFGQSRELTTDSPFIIDLRSRWSRKFEQTTPFGLTVIAGDQDEFVPSTSSLNPFPLQCRAVIPGNHVQMVKPATAADLSVQLILRQLTGDSKTDDKDDAADKARIAYEQRDFLKAIRLLEPRKSQLSSDDLITLATSFEMAGQREEATKILEEASYNRLDAIGALAGRCKRLWLAEQRSSDAERAIALYLDGFRMAEEMSIPPQASYFGINVAFMKLAYEKDHEGAKEMARRTLEYCQKSPRDFWRLAIEGEANLYLGDAEPAMDCFREAVRLATDPQVIVSVHQEASLIAGLLQDESTTKQLESVFRPVQS